MDLISFENVTLAYGEHPLLDSVNFKVNTGEKVFLVGRNGAGKSSLMKLITKSIKPDDGNIRYGTHDYATLSQDLPPPDEICVYDYLLKNQEKVGAALREYHTLINQTTHDEQWYKDLERLQSTLDSQNAWDLDTRIQKIMTVLSLEPDTMLSSMSGGQRRRVNLAQALVKNPRLLLLDEPTNHFDVESIIWLEKYLAEFNGAIICITHDRALLKKLATRIIELDRGNVYSYECNYEKFLELREHRLAVEIEQNKKFDKKLELEETWIRQGIKARRTRNEGRVRALQELRKISAARQNQVNTRGFVNNEINLSGKKVISAKNINFSYKDKPIVKDFSINLFRGDKVAIVGPNGIGKTTLLKLLLKEIPVESGVVELGTNLEIGYFDQNRGALNPNISAVDNVAEGREFIERNKKSVHIITYLQDFMFSPVRARSKVSILSGGECNRLLLAKLFSKPCNLLILDEPTNDLDIESLEMLESLLVSYTGTVLIISHDRDFIDSVATSTIYFRDNTVDYCVGGYSDIPQKNKTPNKTTTPSTNDSFNDEYKKNKEIGRIENKIKKFDDELSSLNKEIATEKFFTQNEDYINAKYKKISDIEKQIADLYDEWEKFDK